MKVRFLLPVLAAGVLAAAEPDPKAAKAPAAPAPANTMDARFRQVRNKINDLYQHRNEAPPAPDPRASPFRPAGQPVVAPAPAENKPEAPAEPANGESRNLALLQQGAATLRVSGTLEIGGRSHLVINKRPYKQGDVVPAVVEGETIYLRVREIGRRTVTLVLNDAEMTLKY